ncbi:hypothetical protein [Bifidobacterium tsurumiense]|nr:hypothetical protein [Bifidobacterium tsurumiense]
MSYAEKVDKRTVVSRETTVGESISILLNRYSDIYRVGCVEGNSENGEDMLALALTQAQAQARAQEFIHSTVDTSTLFHVKHSLFIY